MLLRHGRVWHGSCWTQAHEQWIAGQRFGEPALAAALAYYPAALDTRWTEVRAIESEMMPWAARDPLAPAVARLGCYRGIAELHGLTLAAEVAGLAPVRLSARVHGLHRPGPRRVLQRR